MTSQGNTRWHVVEIQSAETALHNDLSILRGRKHTDDYYRLGDTNFYSKGIIPLVFVHNRLTHLFVPIIEFQYLRDRKYVIPMHIELYDINFISNGKRKEKFFEKLEDDISAIVQVELRTDTVGVESIVVGGEKRCAMR